MNDTADYCNLQRKRSCPLLFGYLRPINGGFIQILCKMLWKQSYNLRNMKFMRTIGISVF